MAAFNHFDKDRSGTISKDELREGLREGMAGNVPESEIEAILAEVDKDGDGTIDFKEFTAMISKGEPGAWGPAITPGSPCAWLPLAECMATPLRVQVPPTWPRLSLPAGSPATRRR